MRGWFVLLKTMLVDVGLHVSKAERTTLLVPGARLTLRSMPEAIAPRVVEARLAATGQVVGMITLTHGAMLGALVLNGYPLHCVVNSCAEFSVAVDIMLPGIDALPQLESAFAQLKEEWQWG